MMWLSLIVLAFFLATAYFQAIQGMTSAAITCVLSILSLGIAVSSFEYVAGLLMGVKPELAHPVALFLTFIVPFAILRVIMDIVVPRANLVPHVIDRIAGAGFGAIGAIVVTGVLALCIDLMPWGSDGFLAFSRFDPANPKQQNDLWLAPDRVAAWVAGLMSDGAFSGQSSFDERHPDYVTELGFVQSLPRGVRQVVPENAITLRGAAHVPYIYERVDQARSRRSEGAPQYTEKPPDTGDVFTRVTLGLSSDAAGEDNKQRYTPASVRLVGRLNGAPAVYPGIAASDKDTPHRHVGWYKKQNAKEMEPVAGMLLTCPPNNQIDVVFEHPEKFEPQYVEYKLGGRVRFTKADITGESASEGAPTSDSSANNTATGNTSESTADRSRSGRSSGGRVAGVRFRDSHFGDNLPVTLTAYQGRDTDIRSGALVQGQVQGALADQGEKTRDQPISRLEVPHGKFLLQLNVEKLHAKSMLGRALDFSRSTLENYLVEDDRGRQYSAVGKYAVANVGGEQYVEVIYFPEYASGGGRIGDFSRIKRSQLKDNYQLVYLYLIEPGAKVVRFTTGGNARPVDLSDENLVAR